MLRRDLLKAAVAATLAPQCAMGQEAFSASQPSQETPQATTPAGGNPPMCYRFGVNYVNTRDWLYFWNDFDAGQVARDLDAIAAMDMDHLRVFALWPYFQPWRNWVDPGYLRRLDKFMKLAAQRNLDVCLAMLNGWFSGSCLRPIFDEPQNFYTSPRMLESQQQYFRETAAVLKGHRNFLGFDLGNEMTCCWSTHEKTAESDAWMEKLLAYANQLCPEQFHVNGVGDSPWFYPETFSPQSLVRLQKIVCIHCYILFTGALKRGGAMDPPCVKLIAGMAALVRAFANDPAKPVWAQEFGISPEWIDRKLIPRFVEATMHAAIDEGVSWFTWWSSHDVPRKFELNSLEYELGLITLDNKPKEQARTYQSIARQYRGKPVAVKTGKAFSPLPVQRSYDSTWKWLLEWMGR